MINRRGETNSMEFTSSDNEIRQWTRCEVPSFKTEDSACFSSLKTTKRNLSPSSKDLSLADEDDAAVGN